MDFLRGKRFAWVWVILRLWLGYNWVEAGWHKLSGAEPFSAAGLLSSGIKASVLVNGKSTVQPWWGNFLKNFALPNVGMFNFLVQYGELLVGLALLTGFATVFAASMGFIMNFSFVMSGSISTSPVYMILELILIAWGSTYAGYIGVDYWFRPVYRRFMDGVLWKDAAEKSAA